MTIPIRRSIFGEANSSFRSGNYVEAITYYEESLKHAQDPITRLISFNLALARKRVLIGEQQPVQAWFSLKLLPLYQLEKLSNHEYQWRSLGNDPQFIVEKLGQSKITAGWYRIEIKIQSEYKRNTAVLYADYGQGFQNDVAIPISFTSAEPVDQVLRFESDIQNLRFDPMDLKGLFSIDCFKLIPLIPKDAKKIIENTLNANDVYVTSQFSHADSLDELYQTYRIYLEGRHSEFTYEQWIADVESPSLPTREEIDINLSRMTNRPLISIVLPTYNTSSNHLKSCIGSVINQSYPHWELCIADDASDQPHVKQIITEFQKTDKRIKVVFRHKNGHISRASNSALALATGQFVTFLDHDDQLSQHALYFVAITISQTPSAQLIYTDEDKINEHGVRSSPHFKSDWNPDLLFSQNYICHLAVYKRELVARLNGLRPGLEGSQDHDLLLRSLHFLKNNQILHIPRVLYHWRAVKGSTALASQEKSYTSEASLRALMDFFKSEGPRGVTVEPGLLPNTYRVRWPIPDPAPLVSLLIPTRDKKAITEIAVRSILEKTTYSNYEILILDNGSKEPETLAWFNEIQRQELRVRVIRYDHPFNFSAINNFGVKHADGEIIGLVNNDIEVISPEWLTEMVSQAVRPEVGCVGAKLYYSDGRIQHAGVILGIGGVAGHSHKYFDHDHHGYFSRLKLVQALSAVTAACLVVRKSIYDDVGGLDEVNLKVAFNDVDFCLKVREAGYRNLWTPYAELYHHESISRGLEDTPEKQNRFKKEVETMKTRWAKYLSSDPYYNPNLTKDREDFSL